MDQPESAGAGQDDSQRAAKPWASRKRLTLVVVFAAIGAIVGLIVGYELGYRSLAAPASGGAEGGAVVASSAGWRVYHDPLGLFTVRLPPGWVASSSLGSYSEGGPGGSDSGQDEYITFHNVALGAASPSVSIYAHPLHNAAARQMACSAGFAFTMRFHGYPADESMPAVILFDSAGAHFQIDEVIPGVLLPVNPGGPANPPPPPTPPPAATVTAERATLSAFLATFQPTDPQSLACGG